MKEEYVTMAQEELIQLMPYAGHREGIGAGVVELIYTTRGTTRHVINGTAIDLKQGELLFINQNAKMEAYAAGEGDYAVEFILLPQFFDYALELMGEEENMLRSFVVDCLKGKRMTSGFMYFKVADVRSIKNLIDNMVLTLTNKELNKRGISQITMGLLFLHLVNHIDRMQTNMHDKRQDFIFTVLRYIEENYKEAELSELAASLHYDMYWISKEIKKKTGKTYTELLQTKRLNEAAYRLANTKMSVLEIAMAVGYENISYFHKIFFQKFGMTPRNYRILNRNLPQTNKDTF